MQNKNTLRYNNNENVIEISEDDLIIDFDASDGYVKMIKNNKLIILSIKRNDEIRIEGFIKDLARRLQTLRKEYGYKPTDMLSIASIVGLKSDKLSIVQAKKAELAHLIRVKNVNFIETCKKYKNYNIDGETLKLSIE